MIPSVTDTSDPQSGRHDNGQFRVVVVINPLARFSLPQVEAAFARHVPPNVDLIFLQTDLHKSVGEILDGECETASIVVAVGGDGTVSEVAAALLDKDMLMGIVPAGSTNMIAKMNRVPRNLDVAVSLLFGEHRVEQIDVGRWDHRALLHVGGAGLDARIFQRSHQALKRRIGWLAYGPPTISSIRLSPALFTITVDGVTLTCKSRLVLVANSASLIHTRLKLLPGVSRSDGMFDVILFTANDGPAILRSIANLVTLTLHKSPYVVHLKGRDISIHAEPALPFEFDGDVVGMTPFRLEVEPQALSMICGRAW